MTVIKTVTTYKYDCMQGKPLADIADIVPVISSFTEYDRDGNTLTEIAYTNNGKIEHKSEYKYNEKGLLVEETLINDEGFVDEKKRYEYDEKDRQIKEFLIYLDESFDTSVYKYNDSGKLIEKITTDDDGEPESNKEYKYEKDKLISETLYDAQGNILNQTTHIYDENGNETQVTRYEAKDETTLRTEYTYNDEGKRTELLAYNSDNKLIIIHLFKENEKGDLIELVEENQSGKNTTAFTYDEKGNLTEQLETNKAGELNSRIIKKFDDNNNLSEIDVTIDRHGAGLNQNYIIHYEYEYYI